MGTGLRGIVSELVRQVRKWARMVEREPLPWKNWRYLANAGNTSWLSRERVANRLPRATDWAHDKNLHGLAGSEFVLHPFEEEIVPTKHDFVFIELLGFRAEIHVADFAAAAGVAADDDEQALALAGFFAAAVGFDADVIAQRAAKENVVPRGDVQCGHVNVREMVFNGDALPIVVIGGMGKPIEKVRSESGRGSVDDGTG